LSNQNTVINHVLWRYLKPPMGLAPERDCDRCTLSLNEPNITLAQRWHDLKCCAFQPFVANFLCGAMLEAGLSPLPKDRTRARAEAVGILATPEFRAKVDATPDEERGEEHLCTYYDRAARKCGIWRFRPGECSLYYCGNDPKRESRTQWSERVFEMESGLAQMALAHLGFAPADISREVERINGGPQGFLDAAEALEIYRECWAWAKSQTEADVASWLSFDKPGAGE
jgi:hypothetical protein